ncbi:MAG: hypothetical protein JEY94_10620 [Melioribacteraceae bacterium]|nr:hypothetical protein [Melioribacteraceae bacterium]
MTYRDQKRLFEILKRYENKFDGKERQDYTMLKKRHKDEEDLDRLSMGRLEALHEKYHANRVKPNYDNFFKKPDEDKE